MDEAVARERLLAERADVVRLLHGADAEVEQDRELQVEAATADYADAAQPLTAQEEERAIAESLRARLATINRALQRLDEGTYGRSVRSGEPIPDERLEADPAAELTVEEAQAVQR
jgi:DnaK suppressor protein